MLDVRTATWLRIVETTPGMSLEQLFRYTGSTSLKIWIPCQDMNLLIGIQYSHIY